MLRFYFPFEILLIDAVRDWHCMIDDKGWNEDEYDALIDYRVDLMSVMCQTLRYGNTF